MWRKLAVEQRLFDETGLVVGLQVLLQRGEIQLELLISGQEIRLNELCVEPVAEAIHGGAAEIHGAGQVQLLGVAEQVTVVPAGVEVDAEVGRVGDANVDQVQL